MGGRRKCASAYLQQNEGQRIEGQSLFLAVSRRAERTIYRPGEDRVLIRKVVRSENNLSEPFDNVLLY